MDDLQFVVATFQKLENILKNVFGAQGKGLGEYARSIEHILPTCLVKNLLYVAKVRNDLIHSNVPLSSREAFEKRCAEIEQDLIKIASIYNRLNQAETRLRELQANQGFGQAVPFHPTNVQTKPTYKQTATRHDIPLCPGCSAPLESGTIGKCPFCGKKL